MNKTNKNKSVLLSENENMKKEKIKDESTKEIKKVLSTQRKKIKSQEIKIWNHIDHIDKVKEKDSLINENKRIFKSLQKELNEGKEIKEKKNK